MKNWIWHVVLFLFAVGTAASWMPAWILFSLFAWFALIVTGLLLLWAHDDPRGFMRGTENGGALGTQPQPYKAIMITIDVVIWLMLAFTGHWILSTVYAFAFSFALALYGRVARLRAAKSV